LLNLIFKRFYKNEKIITKTPRHQGKQDPKEIQNHLVLLKPQKDFLGVLVPW
jgi:hypothetical protein